MLLATETRSSIIVVIPPPAPGVKMAAPLTEEPVRTELTTTVCVTPVVALPSAVIPEILCVARTLLIVTLVVAEPDGLTKTAPPVAPEPLLLNVVFDT
jgi:hypothetical protein